MTQSDDIKDLAGALAKAQGEMENAAKNTVNPHFKKSYADLAEILNTVRPVLAKHGLSVVQSPSYADGLVTVETLLMHASGQWVRTTCAATPAKSDPQAIGSAITYLRRYSLAAACGIAQEDDDAEGATNRGGNGREQRPAKRQTKPEPVQDEPAATEAQLNAIAERMHHPEITEEERGKVQAWLDRGGITEAQAKATYERLGGWIAEREGTRAAA